MLDFPSAGLPQEGDNSNSEGGSKWVQAPGAYTVTGIDATGVGVTTEGTQTPFLTIPFNTSHGLFEARMYISNDTVKDANGFSKQDKSLQRINELHKAMTGDIISGAMASLKALGDYMKSLASRYTPKGEKLILGGRWGNNGKLFPDMVYTNFLGMTELPDAPFAEGSQEWGKWVPKAPTTSPQPKSTVTTPAPAAAPQTAFGTPLNMKPWTPEASTIPAGSNDLPF